MYCTIIPLLFNIKSITTWLKLRGNTWPVLAGMSCSLWTSNPPADKPAVTCCSKQWVGDRSAQSYVSWVLCQGITVPVSPVACLWADSTYGLVKCAFWCHGLLPNWLTCPSSLYMMWQTEKPKYKESSSSYLPKYAQVQHCQQSWFAQSSMRGEPGWKFTPGCAQAGGVSRLGGVRHSVVKQLWWIAGVYPRSGGS